MDVLEIDGASNRGIDEIRSLRQNVGVRPSRARFKIYIIDEVHMLTREAFNALLKTLEEPPDHVKFIFCTTDPQKMPITILSRCQRFDFAGIVTGSIAARLAQIAVAEGVEADPEALEILARRAAGSMRDGQSLLEQLLAFAPERITTADVHAMLGTAGDEHLQRLLQCILDRDPAGALAAIQTALDVGVDGPQLLEQLLGYLRDCMAAAAGCTPEMLLFASPANRDSVGEAGRRMGLQTTLAAMQVLDETLARLRESTQTRILADLALVRICHLHDLEDLATLIAEFRSGGGSSAAAGGGPVPRTAGMAPRAVSPSRGGPSAARSSSPRSEVSETGPPASTGTTALTPTTAESLWNAALREVSKLTAGMAESYSKVEVPSENRLVVTFPANKRFAKDVCEREGNLARLRESLARLTGEAVRLDFVLEDSAGTGPEPFSPRAAARRPSGPSPQQQLREIQSHPMVKKAEELFGAEPIRVEAVQ
jgi:DNA polymerase-3 subunit gamma/tau